MTDEPDLPALRSMAEQIARDAGAMLLDGLGRARAEVSTKATATDMVTEMDRASEALITAALLRGRPDDGILGEEGTQRAGTSGIRWVVDPLDGTTNYLYDFPGFNVSIAAERDGRSIVGVVLDIVRDELFSAVRGGGATRNGVAITASSCRDVAQALVGTGFGYRPEQRRRQAEVLVEVLPAVRDIRRQGAAALDLCSVACGRLDAYFEEGLAAWDLAAGGLVAAEAGAEVTDLRGGPPVAHAVVVAAAPGIARPLRARLVAAHAA